MILSPAAREFVLTMYHYPQAWLCVSPDVGTVQLVTNKESLLLSGSDLLDELLSAGFITKAKDNWYQPVIGAIEEWKITN